VYTVPGREGKKKITPQTPAHTAVGAHLDPGSHLRALQVPSVFQNALYRREQELAEGTDGDFYS